MIAGSDRVKEFEKLLNQYNGKPDKAGNELYKFDNIDEGEFCAFMDVGAYGAVLSSEYNSRPLVPEVMVSRGEFHVVRKRPSFEDMIKREFMPDW